MSDNPLVKATMSLLHHADGVFSSSVPAERVRDHADTPKGIPNDPGRRPTKR